MTQGEIQFNKLLQKQIAKKFGSAEELPDSMYDLLRAVSQSYDHYEKERLLTERSMDLSSNELMEANHKLNEQAEKLKRTNKDLKEFLFILSHDLKEPLRAIASYVQLIESRLRNQLNSETQEFMQFAVQGVKKMQTMLNALLQYSQVERQREFGMVNMHEVIETVGKNLKEDIARTNAIITIKNELPQIEGNRNQLVMLLQNVLENSLKFRGEENPMIEISHEVSNKQYVFTIKDNGIGLPDAKNTDVFLLFKRLHDKNSYEGLGMGLPICKKIVEHHGGNIWINDANTGGVILNFSIPKP
jgi:light-regulated signal transduction histidine kinase (bacteriophytochrome)